MDEKAFVSQRGFLRRVRRLVIKVGTSTVAHPDGRLNYSQVEQVVRGIADLANEGRQVLLVTSGAIASGLGRIGYQRKPEDIADKQALAAIGQAQLMQMYEKLFAEYGRVVAQVLLTRQDVEDPVRCSNAANTLLRLLDWDVIPIINENDTVAVEEINFGDNDNLSAMVARLVNAELLIILTDTEGLYTADPRQNGEAELVSVVHEITPSLREAAGGTGSRLARGGMLSKLQAAGLAGEAGIPVVVARGSRRGILRDILDGQDVGTLFLLGAAGEGRKAEARGESA